MRVRLTRRAARDLEEIHTFLHERNPRAATAFVQAVRKALLDLTEQPLSGMQTDDPAVG